MTYIEKTVLSKQHHKDLHYLPRFIKITPKEQPTLYDLFLQLNSISEKYVFQIVSSLNIQQSLHYCAKLTPSIPFVCFLSMPVVGSTSEKRISENPRKEVG